jgi:hypothetical protein
MLLVNLTKVVYILQICPKVCAGVQYKGSKASVIATDAFDKT